MSFQSARSTQNLSIHDGYHKAAGVKETPGLNCFNVEDFRCGKLLATGRFLYLFTNVSKVGCDGGFPECALGLVWMLREPRMATMRAKCLKSGIERSITLSKR
ncbi:hypothetical protein DTO169E5_729 [Paecilomyces variotii]|nr:hypothetical protein DTO169E5_729 [Paecilomyces variotii]KAJ9290292.1 hypothetical protein DTO021C3_2291 [Paecilomyces variotii]